MKKLFSVLFLATLMIGSTMAVTNYDGSKEQPHITNQPDQAPDQPSIPDQPSTSPGKGISGVVPDSVPGSETAQNVLNKIDEFGSGLELGNALQGLLGNRTAQE